MHVVVYLIERVEPRKRSVASLARPHNSARIRNDRACRSTDRSLARQHQLIVIPGSKIVQNLRIAQPAAHDKPHAKRLGCSRPPADRGGLTRRPSAECLLAHVSVGRAVHTITTSFRG